MKTLKNAHFVPELPDGSTADMHRASQPASQPSCTTSYSTLIKNRCAGEEISLNNEVNELVKMGRR